MICKCGHIRDVHGYFFASMHCGKCIEGNDWHEYQVDNLLYLEQLYDQKVKSHV